MLIRNIRVQQISTIKYNYVSNIGSIYYILLTLRYKFKKYMNFNYF